MKNNKDIYSKMLKILSATKRPLTGQAAKERSKIITMISVDDVTNISDIPRREFSKDEILKLSRAIKTHGFPKPINVNDYGTSFSIITGEMYWKAAKLLNLEKIPAHIHSITQQKQMEMSLNELIVSEELYPLPIAYFLFQLKIEFKLSDQYLTKQIQGSQFTVDDYFKLLSLSPLAQNELRLGHISMKHIKELFCVTDKFMKDYFLEETIKNNWSPRNLEIAIKLHNHEINCPYCQSTKITRNGHNKNGIQRLICTNCKKTFQ